MLKRHEIEILLKAGHPKTEVARLAGVSARSVHRIAEESPVRSGGQQAFRVLETIGLVLNARYNERRVTILTTNYLDEAPQTEPAPRSPGGQRISVREDSLADRIGERMRSRLYEMCRTIEVFAPDFRREIRQAGRAGA